MTTRKKVPRPERRRAALVTAGLLALVSISLVAVLADVGDLTQAILWGFVAAAAAAAALQLWDARGKARVAQAVQQSLTQDAWWDDLPVGACAEEGRIGLRSHGLWTKALIPAVAVLALLVGGVATLASAGNTELLVAGALIIAFSLLLFGVVYLTAGTLYWLDPVGISHTRWPRGKIAWTDISGVEILPHRLLLHRRSTPHKDFVVAAGVLQISLVDLASLLEALRRQAAGPLPEESAGASGKIEE